MAETTINFIGSVDDWVKKSKARMEAVFRESAQRTASLAQSRIPVDTGYARASIRGSLQSMPPIDPKGQPSSGQSYTYNPGQIAATIAGANLGATIFIGYTAAYANILEFGHSKQAPQGFVRIAVEQWKHTVQQVTAAAKSRAA